MQCLDRHFALQMRVAREVDDALRTSAQFANDLETPDILAHYVPCDLVIGPSRILSASRTVGGTSYASRVAGAAPEPRQSPS